MKILLCKECRQVFIKLSNNDKQLICCDQNMEEFSKNLEIINSSDNKHTPTIRKIGNFVRITIEHNHPMVDVHNIEFIIVQTNNGFIYRHLEGKEIPEVEITLENDEEIINIYANCNTHSIFSLY